MSKYQNDMELGLGVIKDKSKTTVPMYLSKANKAWLTWIFKTILAKAHRLWQKSMAKASF